LDYNRVVPGDVRLQAWLAFGFLLVCLVNTVGLMLAKFLRRSGELSVRRALGASRRALFAQLLTESGVIGIAGGAGGLLLSLFGLWMVRHRASDYASLAHLDPAMLLVTFALAIGASLLAGILPAWRACHAAPAQGHPLAADAGDRLELRHHLQRRVPDRAAPAAHGHAQRHRGTRIGTDPAGADRAARRSFRGGAGRPRGAAADSRRAGGRHEQPGSVRWRFVERQRDALADAAASNLECG